MDNMTGPPKPSLRGKWHQYSQICCKVTDTVCTTAYKAWKHALIVKNHSKSFESLKKNLHWTTNVSTHVLMCSNSRIPFQRMSFYTYCTIHAFFLPRWLCFEQRKITPMSNCSPLGLAAGQRLLHDTWRWCTISSALLFLPAFLAVAEPSRFNATMMVISGCLLKRLSARADGRVLNQPASWTCVSSAVNSPGKYVASLEQSLRDNCSRAFPTWVPPLFHATTCMLWRRLQSNIVAQKKSHKLNMVTFNIIVRLTHHQGQNR